MKSFGKMGFLSSCVMAYLASMLPSLVALPPTLNSKVSEVVERIWNARTEYNLMTRRLQTGEDGISLEEVCQEQLELYADSGMVCACTTAESGNVRIECTDMTCLLCDEALENCGRAGYIEELSLDGNPPDYIVGFTASFQYTKGDRNETAAIGQAGCDINTGVCSTCAAYVDSEVCNSCSYCDDSSGITVDCEGLASNSSFNCSFLPDYGVFAWLSYFTCAFDEPNNNNCINSTLLVPNVPIMGTTNGATLDDIVSDCNLFNDTAKGVWYSVVGTGGPMLASTCSIDTFDVVTFEIYTGEDSCKELQCVDTTSMPCTGFGAGGIVLWDTDVEVTYHVRVATQNYQTQFQIYSLDVPNSDNIACDAGMVGNTIDTVGSTLELSSTIEEDKCGETGTAGLWYTVYAEEDSVMRASTCSNITSLYTTISVATGVDCDSLTCVNSNNASFGLTSGCANGGISVDWNATAGVTYFIYVRGADSNGIFGLTINPLIVPDNDLCKDALIVTANDSVTGSVQNATRDSIAGDACSEQSFQITNGVWYQMTGGGDAIRATACSNGFDEALISVYTGDCSKLVCLSESRSSQSCDNGGGRTVSWQSTRNEVYYLYVYGAGSYEMLVEEFIPAPNSQCSNATGPMLSNNQTIMGSTLNAIPDGVVACGTGDGNSPGLWFWVVGQEGLTYRVDTCSLLTNFDTAISVYSGDCGALTCVASNDDSCGSVSSAVQWKTEGGMMYYIKIHGYFGAVGDFEMTISSSPSLVNDECSGSIPITSMDGIIEASTTGATADNVTDSGCGFNSQFNPGAWFSIEGQGRVVTLSTCSPLTDVSSSITVFEGSCDNLLCVTEGGFDYNCQDTFVSAGVASFLGEEGKEYFILVHSTDGAGGAIGLNFTEIDGVENDFCPGAITVQVDEEITGTTAGATAFAMNNGCMLDSLSPEVWYSVIGTGDVMTATACGLDSDLSGISVLGGNCNDLRCIGFAYVEQNDCASVRFLSVVGETYYILLAESPTSQSSDFSLLINASPAAELGNELCSGAQLVDLTVNTAIVGSTVGTILDSSIDDACFTYSTSGDLWYQVVGSGAFIIASLCGPETDFDSQISIYASLDGDNSCANLECIATNDDACNGVASQAEWASEVDKVYYIRVSGFGSSAGNFALTLQEQIASSP